MNLIKLTIALLSLALTAKADVRKESSLHGSYKVTATKPDATCGKKEAYLELTFKCPEGTCASKKIWFKKNGGEDNFVKISAKGTFTHKLKAGNYEFTFAAADCYTFTTEKIKIEPQMRVSMTVEFEKNDPMIIEEKPVIYLYPEKETFVNVQLESNSEITFTYPTYQPKSQVLEAGWNVLANSDGTLKIDKPNAPGVSSTYNYLFWEGAINTSAIQTNYTEGFIVGADTLVTFLENTLASAGLTTKESADFITYWAPRMAKNQKNYIHFMFTKQYDAIAKLNVTPLPDNVLRLYMIWSDASDVEGQVFIAQPIPSFTRKGFTLVEWGGSEIPTF